MNKVTLRLIVLFLIFFGVSPIVWAQTLYLEPAAKQYTVSTVFAVKLKLNSSGLPINAAQATVNFPADLLEVKSVSRSNSIFNLWPQEPVFSNSGGTIVFSGGLPAPGFNGAGDVMTVNFRAKGEGDAAVSLSGVSILAADGKGTDVLKSVAGATYKIIRQPTVSQPSAKAKTGAKENTSDGSANAEAANSPEILIYPKTYNAGEETFYAEGKAPPNSSVLIFFEQGGRVIKTWEVLSDNKGNWLFFTNDLFKSGVYKISAKTKSKDGNISAESNKYEIQVILKGISTGSLTVNFKSFNPMLVLLIIFLILLLIIYAIYIYDKIKKEKEKARKEIREAQESLRDAFEVMRRKFGKKIEYLDSKPGLSPKESKTREEITMILDKSEKIVEKEINDIEDVLK